MSGFLESGYVWIALLMGLAGSVHCIGMCGGFAVLAGVGKGAGSSGIPFVSAWLTGKTTTYVLLGMALGAMSEAIPTSLSGFQTVIVIFTAVFLILTGLHLAGVGPSWALVAPSPVSSFVSRMSAAVKQSSIWGRFVLGLLNGLLPCGLVYAALAYSLTLQSWSDAAIFMAAFGVGTAPVLALIGLGTGFLSIGRRQSWTRLMGWVIVALGLLTLTRLPIFMNSAHSMHGM